MKLFQSLIQFESLFYGCGYVGAHCVVVHVERREAGVEAEGAHHTAAAFQTELVASNVQVCEAFADCQSV